MAPEQWLQELLDIGVIVICLERPKYSSALDLVNFDLLSRPIPQAFKMNGNTKRNTAISKLG